MCNLDVRSHHFLTFSEILSATMCSMNIRRLTLDDLPLALEGVSSLKPGVGAAHLKDFLADEKNFLVVALMDEQLTGFVLGYKLARIAGDPHMLYIHELEAATAYQRQGVGSALIASLRHLSENGKLIKAFLIAQESNQAAVKFYKNTGAHQPHDDDTVFVYG